MYVCLFFFKQNTAYEMRISYWSSDVCSSDLQVAVPGRLEYEVEAEWLRVVRSRGAVPAFPPIVAGGANACVMHYQSNRAPLREGELLLIDAGDRKSGV